MDYSISATYQPFTFLYAVVPSSMNDRHKPYSCIFNHDYGLQRPREYAQIHGCDKDNESAKGSRFMCEALPQF